MSFKHQPFILSSFIWLVCLLGVSKGYAQQGKPKPLSTLSLTVTTINPKCNRQIQPTAYSDLGDGSITAVASGGTPPYQYDLGLVRPAQNNGYFPELDQGNYAVEVTDAAGDRYSVNVFLSYTLPQPMLQLNVLQLPTSCTNADGAIQLMPIGGTPPYTYSWDGGLTFAPTPTVMTNLQQGYYQLFEVRDANGCLASAPTSAGRTTPVYFMCFACCNLEVDVVVDKTACTNDGQFTITTLNAPPPFYYSLDGVNYQLANSTNQDVNVYTNVAPGVYHVYAKSADGTLIGQLTVTMAKACPLTGLTFRTGPPTCNHSDGSITITPGFGTPPYTYTMDGVNYQTSNVFSDLPAGSYGISAKDATGALESGTATLTVPSTENCLEVTAAPTNSTCGNANGSITVTAATGTAPYTYSNDGVNFVTSNVFSGLSAGAYTLTAKDASGLSGVVQVTIVNTAGPAITAVSAPPFCGNVAGTITINATGGTSPLQYSLDNGQSWQTSNSLPVRAAGQYPLVVQDANGCTATTLQTITTLDTPVVNLGHDTAICTGDSLLLKISGGLAGDQYLWQDNSTANQYWVRQPGSYSMVATNTLNCTAGDSITITGKPLPVFTLGPDQVVCTGQPVPLDPSSSGATYLWSTGSTAPSITATQAGEYWLQETLAQCLYRDSITVSYKPIPSVHLGDDTILCDGQVLLLNAANSDATYRWQDGSATPEYKVQSGGTYSVQVDIDGCDSSGTITVGYMSQPVLNIVPDTTLCITQQLVLDAAYPQSTYLWQDSSTQPQFRVTTEGTYTVQVTNTCGTTEGSSIVKYENCACKFYVPTGFTPNGDGHNDVFRPTYTCLYTHFEMSVFGRWGELMFSTKDPSIGWDGKWQGKAQPAGPYVWMMTYQDQLTGKRFEQKGTLLLIR